MISASEMRLAATAATPPDEAEILNILSVSTFKAEHRITNNAENTRIEHAIKEAYHRLDGPSGWLNRAVLTQTWKGVLERWDDRIEIPLPVLQSVDSIRYRAQADGAWTVLSTDVYGIDLYGLVGKVYRKKDQSWPDVYSDEPGAIEITFTAGWGTGAQVLAAAPGMRKALKLLAGHYFYNPTPTFVEPRLVEVPRKIHYGLVHTLGALRIWSDPS